MAFVKDECIFNQFVMSNVEWVGLVPLLPKTNVDEFAWRCQHFDQGKLGTMGWNKKIVQLDAEPNESCTFRQKLCWFGCSNVYLWTGHEEILERHYSNLREQKLRQQRHNETLTATHGTRCEDIQKNTPCRPAPFREYNIYRTGSPVQNASVF